MSYATTRSDAARRRIKLKISTFSPHREEDSFGRQRLSPCDHYFQCLLLKINSLET